ncbi:MAG: glucosaminidase domain-containing protein [Bacilli bacterium]
MEIKFYKKLIVLFTIFSLVFISYRYIGYLEINAEDSNANYNNTQDISGSNDSQEVIKTQNEGTTVNKSSDIKEDYVENGEKYLLDENGNSVDVIDDRITNVVKDSKIVKRNVRTYGMGYIDFFGKSSAVLNVYKTASSNSAYTYFNTGSSERVATLGEANGRVKIAINGFVGFVDKTGYIESAKYTAINNISTSYSEYYIVNNSGDLLYNYGYYESYATIVVGKAPSFLTKNKQYYSLDGIFFYTNRSIMLSNYNSNTVTGAINASNPFYNYYQYLPFRSRTNLTNTDFKNFINSKLSSDNASKSVLNNYDVINQFFTSQDDVSVNAALEFSMAMLESGYGTSEIAKDKNNLFGWGAVDSGPYEGAFKFASVSQGVDYHFNNAISTGYLDVVQDSRYYGGSVGNKNTGVNVKYASDPFWGMKIAGIYYNMDKKAGFKDYNYYKLAILNRPPAYVYLNGNYSYTSQNVLGKLNVAHIPYLVVGENSSQISIISDIGVCNSGDEISSLVINQSTLAIEKKYYKCLPQGVHFGAKVNFNDDIVEVYKDRIIYAGGSTIRKPQVEENSVIVNDMTYVLKEDGKFVKYAYKKNSLGKITNYYEYYGNVTVDNAASKIKFVFNMNTSNNTIINAYSQKENSIEILKYFEYIPYTSYDKNGSHGSKIRYIFDMEGNYINEAFGYNNGIVSQVYDYAKNTTYGTHGIYITGYHTVDKNGYLKDGLIKKDGEITSYLEYPSNTRYVDRYDKKSYQFNVDSSRNITYAKRYNSSGKVINYYEYNLGTKYGNHNYNIRYMFDMEGNYINEAFGYNNGVISHVYDYAENTTYGTHGIYITGYHTVDKNGYLKDGLIKKDGKITSYLEYPSNTRYVDRYDKKSYQFNVDSSRNITYAKRYNSSGKVINYYEYNLGTKYGNHGSRIKFIFYINSSTGYIDVAYSLNSNWQRIIQYKYKSNTKYNPNGGHGKNIKSSIRLQ